MYAVFVELIGVLSHVMLRDGLLSPHSKLLPESSRASSPLRGRPGSMLSVASTCKRLLICYHDPADVFVGPLAASIMTKSGLYKDQRDTHRRRIRHRDGRLLKEGVGLTTGLGWSDRYVDTTSRIISTQITCYSARMRMLHLP